MIFLKNSTTIKKLSFLVVLIFTLHSCYNDPQFLGNNLIPEDDIYGVKVDTLFEVSAYTIKNDSLNTQFASEGVFGYVNSEIFGSTKASFVGRFLPMVSKEGYGGATAEPDSLFFYFVPAAFYGDSTLPINIKVHELTDTAVLYQPNNGLNSIDGHFNATPFFTSAYTGGKALKYPLDLEYAKSLMDSSALANPVEFYTKFKGFYITCDDIPGNGGVAYSLNTSSFYFRLFYHYNKLIDGKDSTLKVYKDFRFALSNTANASWFYQYQHDYSKADPSKAIKSINDTINQDSVFYIQGLGGVYGKIKLDDITSWVDSLPLVIHKAELIIGKDLPLTATPDSTLKQLGFYYKVDDSWAGFIVDQNGVTTNGRYRAYNQEYSVLITTHLQRVLEGEIKDRNIYVLPYTSSIISRAVLQSGTNSRKLKLRITYTKLK